MFVKSAIPGISSSFASFKSTFALVVIALVCAIFPWFFRRNIVDAHGHPIPPGPLLRYAFLRKYPERALAAWSQKYGPLFSVWMGNQLFVVISDARIARDLLVTNGSIFSSRRQYFMKNKTILNGRAITASAYDDRWRQHRRIASQLLTPKAISGYATMIDYEAHMMIRTLYRTSMRGTEAINPSHYIFRYTLNNMLTVSFAYRAGSTTDPLVERAHALATEFMDLTGPWANAIDFVKPLQWLPSRLYTRGRKLHDGIIEVYGAMILRVKARMDAGEDVPDCLVKTLILTQEKEGLDWEDMCMLAAVFTLGGVHTTLGVILWFLALISSHPEIQERAHEELDRVVGRDAWPSAEDEPKLPYIRAVIKEVERAHAPFWMATPHYSTEDFVYNGMYIPKNTAVVLNCYDIHHNEERYPEPFAFKPERFFGDTLSSAESSKLPNAMDRDHWAFGAGRRICPGMHVAEHELFLAISRLLWTYRFETLPGEPISLEEYDGESGRTPKPFRMMMIPRHQGVQSILDERDEITLNL
ncbi:cytochrome P450 [Amylostereum chailletii]|nr:cytochrome P450 [Amylostereum chailletii]